MNMNTSSSPQRVDDWLKSAESRLADAGISSAHLDALILLEDCLDKDRAWLLAHPEYEIKPEFLKKLGKQISRRCGHEPLAYIRGFSEFYGRRFKVSKRVLEPRPESETMIDLLLGLPLPSGARIADVGTGSGCLGITAALELATDRVDLFDIDAGALAVAKHNMVMHELRLRLEKRDLLSRSRSSYDAVLANLPYVPSGFRINPAAAREPKIAIFGGEDGLDVYRRLFAQIGSFKKSPHFVLTESLPPQHKELVKIAAAAGYHLVKTSDLVQVFSRA